MLHLVDHEIEKFAATADMLEWACRVAGRIMSKGDVGEELCGPPGRAKTAGKLGPPGVVGVSIAG